MKLLSIASMAIALPLAFSWSAKAENPAHVQQLIETNLCAGCDLSDADLTQAHLIGADLRDADLSGANLNEANLEGADLTGADLSEANLTSAFLTNAVLQGANLNSANLTEAQIYYADVTDALTHNLTLTRAEVVGTPISVGGN